MIMKYPFRTIALTILISAGMILPTAAMQLTVDGRSVAPIVVASGASEENLAAAQELAEYIALVSGAMPELLTEPLSEVPTTAIWVGYHELLQQAMPGVDFSFTKPEEILIVCRGQHLAILGSDLTHEGVQLEFGTVNAVSTFVQDQLNVRRLWPGPIGLDVIPNPSIEVAPMEYRYHPQFLQRQVYSPKRASGPLREWSRLQRIQNYSWQMSIGHAFSKWWEMYHIDHPEYFALQPDGTRSGFPAPHTAKLCETNPEVWQQWWQNAAETLAADPSVFTVSAAPNDGSNAGICICENCQAWDNPNGRLWRYNWQGFAQEYYAMTDRYVRFWNTLAEGIREQYPDRKIFVTGLAYGPAKPPPVDQVPADNVAIGFVGHFPITSEATRATEKEDWQEWSKVAKSMIFRPNVFWYSGGWHAIPTLAVKNTIEDLRFLAENNCIGLAFDTTPQHWSTQGPQYYAMAQLAWNPFLDGEALMKDYYTRGWGPAADHVAAYFQLMEDAHMAVINTPGWRTSMGIRYSVIDLLQQHYGPETLAKAEAILDQAEQALEGADPKYLERLEFIRTGLEYTRNHYAMVEAMKRVRESQGADTAAVQQALELEKDRDALFSRFDGIALSRHLFYVTWVRSRAMEDYLGPPSEEFQSSAGLIEGKKPKAQESAPKPAESVRVQPSDFTFTPAEKAGWELILSDDFDGDALSSAWEVVNGSFKVEEGHLIGDGGVLLSTASYDGPVRIEYFASPNIRHIPLPGSNVAAQPTLSDISTILFSNAKSKHAKGYFLQFGGFNNTRCRLVRNGAEVAAIEGGPFILPNTVHHIVAEYDGTHVRLIVDGKLLFELTEQSPVYSEEFDRIGLYFWTAAKVDKINVYTRE